MNNDDGARRSLVQRVVDQHDFWVWIAFLRDCSAADVEYLFGDPQSPVDLNEWLTNPVDGHKGTIFAFIPLYKPVHLELLIRKYPNRVRWNEWCFQFKTGAEADGFTKYTPNRVRWDEWCFQFKKNAGADGFTKYTPLGWVCIFESKLKPCRGVALEILCHCDPCAIAIADARDGDFSGVDAFAVFCCRNADDMRVLLQSTHCDRVPLPLIYVMQGRMLVETQPVFPKYPRNDGVLNEIQWYIDWREKCVKCQHAMMWLTKMVPNTWHDLGEPMVERMCYSYAQHLRDLGMRFRVGVDGVDDYYYADSQERGSRTKRIKKMDTE
jgi:hypothetical protein